MDFYENNNLKELSKEELIKIEGGLHWFVVLAAGYLFGEVVEGVQDGISRRNAGECC